MKKNVEEKKLNKVTGGEDNHPGSENQPLLHGTRYSQKVCDHCGTIYSMNETQCPKCGSYAVKKYI